MSTHSPYRVLFVCLGNICRSPAAEIVFNAAVKRAGLQQVVLADSCGTASYHTGEKPDHRMLAALERAGYAWGGHRARTFSRRDFEQFDLIIPQDDANRRDILSLAATPEQKPARKPRAKKADKPAGSDAAAQATEQKNARKPRAKKEGK